MVRSHAHSYCQSILPKVSRTFAINIEVLNGELYRAVLCGYLFCRIIDTVEDSHSLPLETQQQMLDQIIEIFKTKNFDPDSIRKWSEPFHHVDKSNDETDLACHADLVFQNFESLPKPSRAAIGRCVIEMSEGMKKTLAQKRNHQTLYTLETLEDLETYCYYVAGTVGVLLSSLFAEHRPSISASVRETLEQRQVSFGLGLQLTNIIKDCREDYHRGWCYIPRQTALTHHVPLEHFFDPGYHKASMAVLGELITKAARHLDDALEYTLAIPKKELRVRLFCLWPLFFAVKTLAISAQNINLLTGKHPVKITRQAVYRTLLKSTVLAGSNTLLTHYYHQIRRHI